MTAFGGVRSEELSDLFSLDALTWFVNPDDYADLIPEWLEVDPLPIVWGRTAFADLMVWNGRSVYKLFVHTGMYGRMMRDIEGVHFT